MAGKILITRPEEDARPLADALGERGIQSVIEPLLAIHILPEAAAPLAEDLAGVQAILFTSANGVRAFAELSSRRDIGVLAVGDATAAAAKSAGFVAVESAGGDVNALAALVRQRLKPEGGPLFHAAGSAVAGDLARLLSEGGFSYRRRMLYESRTATALGPQAREALLTGEIDQVVLFSPRTAATFVSLARQAAVDCRRMTALCLSPAVATVAGGLSWRAIETATHPDLPSMLGLIDRARTPPVQSVPEPVLKSDVGISNNNKPATTAPKPEAKAMSNPPPSSPPAASAPPARARSGMGAILLAGIIGAVIAGSGLLAVIRLAPDQLGLAKSSGGDVAALTHQLSDVSTRLATLEQQVAGLPKVPGDIGQLDDRIAALQGDVAALKSSSGANAGPLPPEIASLPQRLSDLEGRVAELKPADLSGISARLAALEQRPAGGSIDPAALSQIKSDLAAFDQRLKAAEAASNDIAGLKQAVAALAAANAKSGNGAAGIALAINQLQRLVAAGKPYGPAIAALESFTSGNAALRDAIAPSLATLKAGADKGVPSLADLEGSFPATADTIAHAASSAESAAPDASFGERVLARLSSLVTVRPEGENAQGDDPLARLARGEAKVNAGDIEGAVGELSGLPAGPVADAAKPWLDKAQARLDAQAALDKLESDALSALAASTGGAQ